MFALRSTHTNNVHRSSAPKMYDMNQFRYLYNSFVLLIFFFLALDCSLLVAININTRMALSENHIDSPNHKLKMKEANPAIFLSLSHDLSVSRFLRVSYSALQLCKHWTCCSEKRHIASASSSSLAMPSVIRTEANHYTVTDVLLNKSLVFRFQFWHHLHFVAMLCHRSAAKFECADKKLFYINSDRFSDVICTDVFISFKNGPISGVKMSECSAIVRPLV